MDKKVLFVLITLLAASAVYFTAEKQTDSYLIWKEKFGYKWTQEEDTFRRLIFNKNIETIEKHNADSTQTYKMAVNQFTGLTEKEF